MTSLSFSVFLELVYCFTYLSVLCLRFVKTFQPISKYLINNAYLYVWQYALVGRSGTYFFVKAEKPKKILILSKFGSVVYNRIMRGKTSYPVHFGSVTQY